MKKYNQFLIENNSIFDESYLIAEYVRDELKKISIERGGISFREINAGSVFCLKTYFKQLFDKTHICFTLRYNLNETI